MASWNLNDQIWYIWPRRPIGILEIIGGSYLGSSPNITYSRLLESLANLGFAIHAWKYIPSFDHQLQANQAWKDFRECRKRLQSLKGQLPNSVRIGHSLGCKLHLLAPDGGRNCKSIISISFNNFNANSSIPLLGKITRKLDLQMEFSPSPNDTLKIISEKYIQPNNLLISYKNDQLDQTKLLEDILSKRPIDKSKLIFYDGDHLTPASGGIRKKLLGGWADDKNKRKSLKKLVEVIYDYAQK